MASFHSVNEQCHCVFLGELSLPFLNIFATLLVRRPEHQIGESAYPVSPTGNFGTFR